MANHYRSVLAGGAGATGDAVAADVLTGKTFSNASAVGIAGSMPNNGAVAGVATLGQPYTIAEGYHNGLGSVTAGAPTTLADINITNIAGKSASSATGLTIGDVILIMLRVEDTVSSISAVGLNVISTAYHNATTNVRMLCVLCVATNTSASISTPTEDYANGIMWAKLS